MAPAFEPSFASFTSIFGRCSLPIRVFSIHFSIPFLSGSPISETPPPITTLSKSKSKIKLYWVGYNNELKLYGELDPNGIRRQNSYENNTWLITDSKDNPLGYFVCGAQPAVAVITE